MQIVISRFESTVKRFLRILLHNSRRDRREPRQRYPHAQLRRRGPRHARRHVRRHPLRRPRCRRRSRDRGGGAPARADEPDAGDPRHCGRPCRTLCLRHPRLRAAPPGHRRPAGPPGPGGLLRPRARRGAETGGVRRARDARPGGGRGRARGELDGGRLLLQHHRAPGRPLPGRRPQRARRRPADAKPRRVVAGGGRGSEGRRGEARAVAELPPHAAVFGHGRCRCTPRAAGRRRHGLRAARVHRPRQRRGGGKRQPHRGPRRPRPRAAQRRARRHRGPHGRGHRLRPPGVDTLHRQGPRRLRIRLAGLRRPGLHPARAADRRGRGAGLRAARTPLHPLPLRHPRLDPQCGGGGPRRHRVRRRPRHPRGRQQAHGAGDAPGLALPTRARAAARADAARPDPRLLRLPRRHGALQPGMAAADAGRGRLRRARARGFPRHARPLRHRRLRAAQRLLQADRHSACRRPRLDRRACGSRRRRKRADRRRRSGGNLPRRRAPHWSAGPRRAGAGAAERLAMWSSKDTGGHIP